MSGNRSAAARKPNAMMGTLPSKPKRKRAPTPLAALAVQLCELTGAVQITIPVRTKSEMNCRDHWHVLAKRKRLHHAVTAGVLSSVPPLWRASIARMPRPLRITLTRLGPRRIDSDGASSGSKFVRDEIARWLGIDDGDDAAALWNNAREIAPMYGVRVRIEAAKGAE